MAIDTRHCACGLTFEVSEWSSRPDCDACREILSTPFRPNWGDMLQNEYNASTYIMPVLSIDDALGGNVLRNTTQRFRYYGNNEAITGSWGTVARGVLTENE